MNRIDEVVDRYLTEGNEKDDFKKVLKVIQSIKTKEHLEGAYNMIRNWFMMYVKGQSISGSFGMRSVFDVMAERSDLVKMLYNKARNMGDDDFIKELKRIEKSDK